MKEGKGIDGDSNHNEPNRQNQINAYVVIGGGLTVGSVIGFCLGSSTNGLYNFFPDPRMQLYPFVLFLCAGLGLLTIQAVLRFENVPWLYMVAAVISCFFFVLATKVVDKKLEELSKAKAESHFYVTLADSDFPSSVVELTNAFLVDDDRIMKGNNSVPGAFNITYSEVSGDVIIPIKSFDHFPKLYFGVREDSGISYNPPIPWEFSFCFLTNFDFSPEGAWLPRAPNSPFQFGGFKHEISPPIIGGNGVRFEGLQVNPCEATSNKVGNVCFVQISPSSFPRRDLFLYFWLVFPVTTNITHIHVVQATNGVFNFPSRD